MKSVKIGLTVLLWLVVLGLVYKLYTVVNDPVQFKVALKVRSTATQNRLLDIKVAQEYYREKNNTYATNFDDLINTVKNDKLTIIKTMGDEDDTTVVVTYDTILVPIIDEIISKERFRGTEDVNQLRYIPLTESKSFTLAMDTITLQRVKLAVFQAKATKDDYLDGLDKSFIKNPAIEDLSIGSLTSASGKGSWE
ncbi:MAG: hypothetical protein ACI8ZX_000631 [Planctomycetota bacterium]|jgi:hypothetical protein